jgi:hypothetical protein
MTNNFMQFIKTVIKNNTNTNNINTNNINTNNTNTNKKIILKSF